MNWWIIILLFILALQFTVIRFAPPYLPTLSRQRQKALDLLDLKPGQTLIDLGSGDGTVLIAAAERGIKAIGYEINPLLVVVAKLRTRKYGDQVQVIWGNFWKKQWPQADAVFAFLIGGYMSRLDGQMKTRFKQPVKLVSHAFPVPGRKAVAQTGAFFLYRY